MEWIEFTTRVFIALILGTAIGTERQWRQRMAGLRTNALVAVGAALYVILSDLVIDDISPTRVAAQVVSGIGFLGAGVIMKEGANIRGLNTAATLWCAAAIGVLSGSGFTIHAVIGTLIVLNANILLRSIQQKIPGEHGITEVDLHYKLDLVCNSEDEAHIRSLLLHTMNDSPLKLISLSSKDMENPAKMKVTAVLVANKGNKEYLEQIVKRLSLEKSVSAISWEVIMD